MEPSQAFSEIVELVTNKWIAPFIHPERYAGDFQEAMDESRAERHAAGCFTDKELEQIRHLYQDDLDGGRLSEVDYQHKNDALNASVKGLTSDGVSFVNASDYPNLMVIGGKSIISGKSDSLLLTGGRTTLMNSAELHSLRKVGGDLEITTSEPCVLNSLHDVRGDLKCFNSLSANKLLHIDGECGVFHGELDLPNLKGVKYDTVNVVNGTLSEGTKDALRRMKSSKVFQDLSRSEAQGISQGIKMK